MWTQPNSFFVGASQLSWASWTNKRRDFFKETVNCFNKAVLTLLRRTIVRRIRCWSVFSHLQLFHARILVLLLCHRVYNLLVDTEGQLVAFHQIYKTETHLHQCQDNTYPNEVYAKEITGVRVAFHGHQHNYLLLPFFLSKVSSNVNHILRCFLGLQASGHNKLSLASTSLLIAGVEFSV